VEDFEIGQKIIIDKDAKSETAIIEAIGTPGGTTVGTATDAGTTVIQVSGIIGFSEGQTVTIDSGENRETAVIVSITAAQRNFWNRDNHPLDTIKVADPLTKSHSVGVQVSGSGITLSKPLAKAHENGALVAGNLPTPGKPNQYFGR
jgi:hypothetical protein